MKYLLSALLLVCSSMLYADADTVIDVYRSPDCQCCHRWIEHLEQHQFKVIDHITQNMTNVKDKAGLPLALASCHTAIVDGYVIEGHVPANDILRLITEKSELKGLSVPQMPVGTPGMEMGTRKDNFSVISFDKQGKFKVYNQYQVDADNHYQALHQH